VTLRQIERVSRHPLARHHDEARRRIRFSSHRVGEGDMLVIWVGPDLAAQIGIDCARTAVDLLLDEDFATTRLMGIRANRDGQFRAARRSQNVGIYLNCDSFEHYFGRNVWFHDLVDETSVSVENGLLKFAAPKARPSNRKVDLKNRAVEVHGDLSFGGLAE